MKKEQIEKGAQLLTKIEDTEKILLYLREKPHLVKGINVKPDAECYTGFLFDKTLCFSDRILNKLTPMFEEELETLKKEFEQL